VRATYSFSFEFDSRPPLTVTGTTSASQMPTCLARAARKAIQEHPGVVWRSVVCVLEREEEAKDA